MFKTPDSLLVHGIKQAKGKRVGMRVRLVVECGLKEQKDTRHTIAAGAPSPPPLVGKEMTTASFRKGKLLYLPDPRSGRHDKRLEFRGEVRRG